MTTTVNKATAHEEAKIGEVRAELKEHSLEVGSYIAGMKNELADKGGVLVLELAERIAYDYDIRQSVMRVRMELAGYTDHHASEAYQLRQRAEVLVWESALQVRDMLNRGVL